jgi:hypothetical protein
VCVCMCGHVSVLFYQTPSVGWVPFPCPESCMLLQNLQIWVSIVWCKIIYNFLSRPLLPPAGAVGEQLLELLSCNSQADHPLQFISSTWLILSLTLGYHTVAA